MESKTFAIAALCLAPLACQPANSAPSRPDPQVCALQLRVDARDEALASVAWDFELTLLDSTGARIGPNEEPGGPPFLRGRLVTATDAQRREVRYDERQVASVWDGEHVHTRTLPIAKDGAVTEHAVIEESDAPTRPVNSAADPLSFGIGFLGSPLAHWLRTSQLVDLGLEPVRGVPCRKLLVLNHDADSPATHPRHNLPRGVLWIDEQDTLLILRARTYVPLELATEATDAADGLHFEGRDFAPQSTYDVLETKRIGGYDLPILGRLSLVVPGGPISQEIDIEPALAPESGWPEGTFEL